MTKWLPKWDPKNNDAVINTKSGLLLYRAVCNYLGPGRVYWPDWLQPLQFAHFLALSTYLINWRVRIPQLIEGNPPNIKMFYIAYAWNQSSCCRQGWGVNPDLGQNITNAWCARVIVLLEPLRTTEPSVDWWLSGSNTFWFAGKLIFVGSYWTSNPAVSHY